MKLRNYQQECVNAVKRNKKNLIHLATGGGKSVIFKHLAREEIIKNEMVLFLVAGVSILDQAVKKHFAEISNDVSFNSTVGQIACYSIDTLARRPSSWDQILREYKYIIIDEAHHCTADRYQKFLSNITESHTVVGLTATPYRIGKRGHTFWEEVIHPISVQQLIAEKFLVFPKCFISEIKMNTQVKTTAGEFNNKQLFETNDNMKVYGSIIDEYKKHGANKKAICFAVNIEHSEKIAQEFRNHGIKAVHADAKTDMHQRSLILRDFEFGDIQVLCNVNIFSTGIDIPIAEVGIMARPTKSKVLWIQQVGRLLRPHPNKKFATILDHGGNVMRLCHPIEKLSAELADKTKNETSAPKEALYTCDTCFYVYSEKTKQCPMCGAVNEVQERKIKEEKEQKLKEFQFKMNAKATVDAETNSHKAFGGLIRRQCEITLKACLFEAYVDKAPLLAKEIFSNRKNAYGCDASKGDAELKEIIRIIKNAVKWQHKPNSIFFKIYDLYPETNYLKFPNWFLRIKEDEQLQGTPELNS